MVIIFDLDYNNITTVKFITKEHLDNYSTIEDDSFSADNTCAATNNLKSKKRLSQSQNIRNNSAIVKKLYEPFVKKKSFYTSLNTNLTAVKEYTKADVITNYKLKKSYREINKISNDTLIFNNPSKMR
jgi:hypothetical protein